MKYVRLTIAVLLTVFILVACQNPDQSTLEASAGKWDASTWNQAQWE